MNTFVRKYTYVYIHTIIKRRVMIRECNLGILYGQESIYYH